MYANMRWRELSVNLSNFEVGIEIRLDFVLFKASPSKNLILKMFNV